jgi:hypothetical protein
MAAGWAHALATGRAPARFEGRILGVDLAVAEGWGDLMARGSKIGLNLSVMDAFFAATAGAHGLTLVTRNTKHFERLGASLINPWLERAPRKRRHTASLGAIADLVGSVDGLPTDLTTRKKEYLHATRYGQKRTR